MVEKTRSRPSAMAFARNALLLLCLLAPSAWMIGTIPPLWRDVDAYIQVTEDPRVTTFWGHGPAYPYIAKIPLFLGELWERSRGLAVANPPDGVSRLTDTGVWLLIVGQHLALTGAAYYFIIAISRSVWIRLVLAVLWASNALFYTFAHCVGSESLSIIVTMLAAGKGLRLIRAAGEPSWQDWYLFAGALWLCVLTRHVNVLLILLLPAAFLFLATWNFLSNRISAGRSEGRVGRTPPRTLFRNTVIALVLGICCQAVADSATQALARKTKLHPHSRMGHTFSPGSNS